MKIESCPACGIHTAYRSEGGWCQRCERLEICEDEVRRLQAEVQRKDKEAGMWEGAARLSLERADQAIAQRDRLKAAIEAVLADDESQHPGGWGPDVTTVAFLREALK